MSTEQSTRPTGRPCSVCGSAHREAIEAAILDGGSLSSLSATFGMSRSSLRRHLGAHMEADREVATAYGLDSASIALRLADVAERARVAALAAEDGGRLSDMIRAGDGERRALESLAALGVRHEHPLRELEAFRGVTRAVLRAARLNPEVGEAIATQLDLVDRVGHAREIRAQFQETKELGA